LNGDTGLWTSRDEEQRKERKKNIWRRKTFIGPSMNSGKIVAGEWDGWVVTFKALQKILADLK